MEKEMLKALYYIRKNQILQFYRLNPENCGYSKSYVYAISHDCYPLFQSDEESDLYVDCYSIKKEFFHNFIKYIDEECWIKQEYKTFYQLEDMFGHENRTEMMVILRYCFLDERFSRKEFWETITKNGECPSECRGLADEFSEWEVY